jgi:ribonuclease P protein component
MFNSGLDIVVIARAGVKDMGYRAVNEAMLHLARLHGIIAKDQGCLQL